MTRSRSGATIRTALLILLALVLLVLAGPRPEADLSWDDVSPQPPLDEWLAAREAAFDDIRPGTEKGIVWADSVGERTPYAVVYLHGFSASRLESTPYPDSVAKALGANLYYPRLPGHGRDGEALGESKAHEWIQGVAEAIRVGEAIGDSLIVMGLSTGGALAAAAALEPSLSRRWAAQVWISPYFALRDERAGIVLGPWGRVLFRFMAGTERSWTPQNDLHAALGTHSYPSKVILELIAMVNQIEQEDFGPVTIPTLMIYSPDDMVVRPDVGLAQLDELGSTHKDTVVVRRALDRNNHVIVGDALGPENTIPLARRTIQWLAGLGIGNGAETESQATR